MREVEKIRYIVRLSYRNEFIFDELSDAATFLSRALKHSIDTEDIKDFEIIPCVKYKEETPDITEPITEDENESN